jgi:Tfp pilus assembly protein PilO
MGKLITAIIALIIAGSIFVGYTMPTFDKTKALKEQNGQFDAALGKAKELQTLKQSLLSRYNTFSSDDLTRLNKLLPDHVDNVRLVLDLDSLASRFGIAVQNVVISRPDAEASNDKGALNNGTVLGQIGQQSTPYNSMTLQFTTQTTYANFVAFMKELEASLRIVDITSLTIQPVPNSSSANVEPLYRFTIAVKTYWLKK